MKTDCEYCKSGDLPWWDEFWMHTINGSNLDCNAGYPRPLTPREAADENRP